MTANANAYTADSITILEGLQAVRKRPAMYIGSTDYRGLHHLVYEVVDNSIDEAMAGYCTRIEVVLHMDNSVYTIHEGDSFYIPSGSLHNYMNRSKEEAVIVVYFSQLVY